MQVKVGDTVYDGNDQPIMVILTDEEKKQIANMEGDSFCVFPQIKKWTKNDHAPIKAWMDDLSEKPWTATYKQINDLLKAGLKKIR